jgi:hypothetical protein
MSILKLGKAHDLLLEKYHKALLAKANARKQYIVADEHAKAVRREVRAAGKAYAKALAKVIKPMTHSRS